MNDIEIGVTGTTHGRFETSRRRTPSQQHFWLVVRCRPKEVGDRRDLVVAPGISVPSIEGRSESSATASSKGPVVFSGAAALRAVSHV